jgi:hypothetical protein
MSRSARLLAFDMLQLREDTCIRIPTLIPEAVTVSYAYFRMQIV